MWGRRGVCGGKERGVGGIGEGCVGKERGVWERRGVCGEGEGCVGDLLNATYYANLTPSLERNVFRSSSITPLSAVM